MSRPLGSAYVLEEPIGRGAMGEVWRGRAIGTGEPVAAKLLRSEYTSDPEILTRFVQERSILVGLRHHHLVTVRDLVVEGTDLAIVMDLVVGTDLRGYLDEHGPLPPADAVRMVAELFEGLAAAHAAKVLHRDVKPDNVLLDKTGAEPVVRLSDFGIARLAEGTVVRMSQLIGTPDYMAPEVISTEEVSAAADVYAAGVVLYEALAGRAPFSGRGNAYAVVQRHVHSEPPPLPGLAPPLWAAIQQLLAKDPAARPTATAACTLLRSLLPDLAGEQPLPRQPEILEWAAAGAPGGPSGPSGPLAGERPVTGDLDADGTVMRTSGPIDDGTIVRTSGPIDDGTILRTSGPIDDGTILRTSGPIDDGTLLRAQAPPAGATIHRTPGIPSGHPAPAPAGGGGDEPLFDPGRPTPRWVIGAGIAAAVVAVAVLVALGLRGGGDGGQGQVPVGTAATVTDRATQGGLDAAALTIDRELVLEIGEDGTAELTATIQYRTRGGSVVAGPVLEPLPEVVLDRTDDTPDFVGVEVDDVAGRPAVAVRLPAEGTERFDATYTIGGIDLTDQDPERLVADALAEIDARLVEYFSNPAANDAAVALLAVTGLEVRVTTTSLRIGDSVVYEVWAVGRGSFEAPLLTVSGSAASYQPFLDRFGGRAALRVSVGGCLDDAENVVDGDVVLRGSQPGNCEITATLGRFTGESPSVNVVNA